MQVISGGVNMWPEKEKLTETSLNFSRIVYYLYKNNSWLNYVWNAVKFYVYA